MSTASLKCASCGSAISQPEKYCPMCGAPAPALGGVSPEDIDLTTSLAGANLLRMRKQFEEARGRLLEILEAHPDSVDAHVLLGDVFRDDGKLDEAAVNYRIAVSLDPDDIPARRKLEDTERRLKALGLPEPSVAAKPTAAQAKAKPGRVDHFLKGDGYRGLINLILLVAGGLILIVFIAALFNAVSNSRQGTGQVVRDEREPARVSAPATQPQNQTTPPRQNQTPATPAQPSRTQAAPARTGTLGEANFLAQLNGSPEIQESGLQVNSVFADPRQRSVTLVIGAQNLRTTAIKTEVLRKGLELSLAVFAMNPDIEMVTVRFDAELPDGVGRTYQTGFLGDIRRGRIIEATRRPLSDQSATELEPYYENVFWHSSWRNLLN